MEPNSIYDKLDPSRRQIRLIQLTSRKAPRSKEIRCKVRIFDLESSPRYKALSYAWGTSEGQQQILLNGRNVLIQRNLYDFLQVFRKRQDRGLIWIDQLCIDQHSVEEKNHQVEMMHLIYGNAWATFIWLGPDPTPGIAFAAIRHCTCIEDNPEEYKHKWHTVVTQPEKAAFYAMLSVPYWTRHWVAQEIAFSGRDTTSILYGHDALNFDNLIRLVQNGSGMGANFLSLSPATELLELYNENNAIGSESGFWGDWTNFASYSFCQDPKDKVFGLQKMFREDLHIAVDYAMSVEDVFMATLACWYDHEFSHQPLDADDWHFVLAGCYNLAAGMGFPVLRDDEVPEDEIEEILEHLRIKPGMGREEIQSNMTWEAFGSIVQEYLLGNRVEVEV